MITATGQWHNGIITEKGISIINSLTSTGEAAFGDSIIILASGGCVSSGFISFIPHKVIAVHGGCVSSGVIATVKRKVLTSKGGCVAGGLANIKQSHIIPNIPIDAVIITINSTPPQTYTLQDRIISIGTIRKPMGGIIGNLENANASFILDNSDGELTALFSPPPIGVNVTIANVFTGIITNITLGQTISIQLEAGARIPLSTNIPLISTTQLSGYRVDKKIPIIYGTTTIEPIAADSTGYQFIIASHPCDNVEAVFVDNSEITGFSWKNSLNSIGTMATITLATALQSNEKLTCRVRGKQSARTGGLLTNPADIVWDILANVCGIELDYNELDNFRTAMLTAGINLSGAITDGRKTIRSTVDDIMTSCGAIWSGQALGIALDYLGANPQTANAIINAYDITSIKVDTTLSGIATSLKLSFNYDYAQNQHTSTMIFDSANAIKQFGRTAAELNASWLTQSRTAAIMGEKYLQWKATPKWDIVIETGGEFKNIVPGQWITINHPYLPKGSVTSLCTNAELEIITGNITLQFSTPADTIQNVTLINLSAAFDPQTMAGTQVQFANGQATMTFSNDKGQPLAGAKATLDGSQIRTTDKTGKVTFSASRGIHHIKVEATGYVTMEGDVEI